MYLALQEKPPNCWHFFGNELIELGPVPSNHQPTLPRQPHHRLSSDVHGWTKSVCCRVQETIVSHTNSGCQCGLPCSHRHAKTDIKENP